MCWVGWTDRGRLLGYSDAGQSDYRRWRGEGALRHPVLARALCTTSSASPDGRSSGAGTRSHAVPTRGADKGMPGISHCSSPRRRGRGDGRRDRFDRRRRSCYRNPYASSFALLCLRPRFPQRRSRPGTGCLAPGSGDRSRQRESADESHLAHSVHCRSRVRRPAGRPGIRRYHRPQLPRLW